MPWRKSFPRVRLHLQKQRPLDRVGLPLRGIRRQLQPQQAASRTGKISRYESVPTNNEVALQIAVSRQPIAVGVDASGDAFRFHRSGVFTGDCGTDLNHEVTIVGYGETDDGMKYWLVKNSWGTNWGENGFGMIQRESGSVEGLCGIAKQASYPLA